MSRPVVMKRPSESTAHKSEKTAEFILPDLKAVKDEPGPPPVAPIQAKLIQEKQDIVGQLAREIEEVKQSAVRQVDEKTQVFNLRQLQLEAKTEELESRKLQVEREINQMLTLKNSKFHEELKEATNTLIDETRKIAPLEKGLESLLENIQKIRLDMIKLFNQGLEDRKKSVEELAATKLEIKRLGEGVKEAGGEWLRQQQEMIRANHEAMLQFEEHHAKAWVVRQELEELHKEKHRIQLAMDEMRAKHQHFEADLQSRAEEVHALNAQVLSLKAEWERLKALHEAESHQQREVEERLVRSKQLSEEADRELYARKSQLTELKNQLAQLSVESENVKMSVEILHGTHERKLRGLHEVDEEIQEKIVQLQHLKQDEIALMQVILNLESAKGVHEAQIAQLKVQHEAQHALQAEVVKVQEAAQAHYQARLQELQLLAKNEEERAQLDVQRKTQQWELEFTEHCVSRKAQLQGDLEQMTKDHAESLLRLKDALAHEAKKAVLDILDVKEFASREARIKAMEDALDVTASKFVLAPIRSHLRRWKIASLVLGLAAIALGVLLYRHW